MIVPATKTPITPTDVGQALRAGWLKLFETDPANQQIAVLMAQSALETGRWKSCYCYNLGNIKPGSKWQGDVYQIRLNEVINGKVVWFDPPHPQTNMRAYASLPDAAADYLWMLRRRFAMAWTPVLNGDPVAFSQALKRSGYYTADEPPYTRAVAQLCREFMRLLLTQESSPPPAHESHQDAPEHLEALALTIAAQSALDAIHDDALAEMTGADTDRAPPMGDTNAED